MDRRRYGRNHVRLGRRSCRHFRIAIQLRVAVLEFDRLFRKLYVGAVAPDLLAGLRPVVAARSVDLQVAVEFVLMQQDWIWETRTRVDALKGRVFRADWREGKVPGEPLRQRAGLVDRFRVRFDAHVRLMTRLRRLHAGWVEKHLWRCW